MYLRRISALSPLTSDKRNTANDKISKFIFTYRIGVLLVFRQTRESVSCSVLFARLVRYFKIVVLQAYQPAVETSGRVGSLEQPRERLVISANYKMSAIQIIVPVLDRCDDRKQLLFCS